MNKKSVRNVACAAVFIAASALGTSAMATHAEVVASAIQIQTYGAVNPVLFYAGSACSNGHLNLSAASSVDLQKILWASVLSAKSANGKVSFEYDASGDDCVISSFSVMPN